MIMIKQEMADPGAMTGPAMQGYHPPPVPSPRTHNHNNNASPNMLHMSNHHAHPHHGSSHANSADYLAQLLKDKKQIAAFPNVFVHVERLLDDEIQKVRFGLFAINGSKKELNLPEPKGQPVNISEKLYVPVKEHPEFNFVGRILGPRGMTAKQLEQDLGCKIMVRGKGSMRDKKKMFNPYTDKFYEDDDNKFQQVFGSPRMPCPKRGEEQNRGKPNWEHLNDELHVLVTVEDTENRARIKMDAAVEEIKKLLVPAAEGEDDLKKKQLMELAIINGTYRDGSAKGPPQQQRNSSIYRVQIKLL